MTDSKKARRCPNERKGSNRLLAILHGALVVPVARGSRKARETTKGEARHATTADSLLYRGDPELRGSPVELRSGLLSGNKVTPDNPHSHQRMRMKLIIALPINQVDLGCEGTLISLSDVQGRRLEWKPTAGQILCGFGNTYFRPIVSTIANANKTEAVSQFIAPKNIREAPHCFTKEELSVEKELV
ncbi:hypothetical protein KGM_208234 [Danaus plexippus plexippus]|uniref:Uncharacterized protein n=1 Tax=Danaus plexippus plexippus TaxID=278856 RepID=A0A212F328_DANPL|nr:hypothetical protein KGM_208234 [Danaus plexippus plexippus]